MVEGSRNLKPWEDSDLPILARLQMYLDLVPVIRSEQVKVLLGWNLDGNEIKAILDARIAATSGRGRNRSFWRYGFQAKPVRIGTYAGMGWHPFLAPIALKILQCENDTIYLGKDFKKWAMKKFGEDYPDQWSEENGGSGVGMMVKEDREGQEKWTLVVQHPARFGKRCAQGILNDIGGMLLKRIETNKKTRVHIVIGIESQWNTPNRDHTKEIIRRYREVLNRNSTARNWDGTKKGKLTTVDFSFGLISGIGLQPWLWKFWEEITPTRKRNHGVHLGTVIQDNWKEVR